MYVFAFLKLAIAVCQGGNHRSIPESGGRAGVFLLRVSIHTTIHSAPTHFALGIISARGAAAPPNPNHKKPHQLLSSQLSSPQPSPLALVAAALMPPRLLGRCSCCGYGCGAGRLAELPRVLEQKMHVFKTGLLLQMQSYE